MTPQEKLHDGNAAIEAEIKQMIEDYRADYEERDSDYFEYMQEFGNEIEAIKRGTTEWKDEFDKWGDERFDACLSQPEWHDHLTGNQNPLFEYPGWSFPSYRDEMIEAAYESIYSYVFDGVEEPDDNLFDDIRQAAEIVVDSMLSNLAVAPA